METNLRTLRRKRGLTQRQLSELSHVPCICIIRYESGAFKPRMDNAIKLAAALGVTVDELIGEEVKTA